jgi:hypothetical protein
MGIPLSLYGKSEYAKIGHVLILFRRDNDEKSDKGLKTFKN